MARYPDIEATLERTRRVLRMREYSPRTEEAYAGWIRRYLRFHDARRAEHMGAAEVEAFLHHLATARHLSGKSRNQAASALAFLYREVLGTDVLAKVPRAREATRVPTVLSHSEALRVIDRLPGVHRLAASLMYGSGVRLSECLAIRLKDLDFELGQLVVRDGKGAKDRVTVLPRSLRRSLEGQVARVARLHERDRAGGGGWAVLPGALHRKDPGAGMGPGVAVPLSGDPLEHRRGDRTAGARAAARDRRPKGREAGRTTGGNPEEGHLPHLPSLLRHPAPEERARRADRPGPAGAQGHPHDHALPPRHRPDRGGGAEPAGPAGRAGRAGRERGREAGTAVID